MSGSRLAPALTFAVFLLSPHPGQTSTLSVLGSSGEPVPGATVQVLPPAATSGLLAHAQSPLAEGTTDASGRIDLPVPGLEDLLLLVDHPEHLPLALRVHGQRLPQTLRLSPGLEWAHQVVASGPLGDGGRVCASWTEDLKPGRAEHRWRRCALVSTDGRFRLVGLPQGEVDLSVTVPGFLPLRRHLRPAGEPTLRLEEGWLLRGRVTGPHDVPVAGATIVSPEESRTETGSDGTFEMAVGDLPTQLEVTASGYRKQTAQVRPFDGKAPDILVKLVPGEQITGTLVGEQSVYIPQAHLWMERLLSESARQSRQHDITTERGDFRVDLPAAGRYRIRVRAEGYMEKTLPEITVAPGESYSLGIIGLDRGAGVTGSVIDELSGEALAKVDILLLPQGPQGLEALRRRDVTRTVTGDEGDFALYGLTAGRYELRAQLAGYAPATLPVNVPADELVAVGDIALHPGVFLRGRVQSRSGAPRPGLLLRFFGSDQSTLIPIAERTSDTEGRFEGPHLAPGDYRVNVLGERLLLSQEVEILREEEEKELILTVDGVHLRGLVTRGEDPVQGGKITLVAALDPAERRGKILVSLSTHGAVTEGYGLPEMVVSAEVGADGRFDLPEAPSGLLWAIYVAPDGRSATRQVLVPDQPSAEVVIEVSGITLNGQVVDEETDLGVKAQIRVVSDLGKILAGTHSDEEGFFSIPDLQPGRYSIEVTAQGFAARALKNVAVQEPGAPLRIPLRRGNSGSLTVQLARADGSSVAGAPVTLLNESGIMVRSLPTDVYGRRTFTELTAGTYFLVWTDPLAGTGVSDAIVVGNREPEIWKLVLPEGGSVELLCEVDECRGAPIEWLAVYSAQGVELSPYLSGVSAILRLSAAGDLTLGRMSPGSYRIRLQVRGQIWEKAFSVASGDTLIRLP